MASGTSNGLATHHFGSIAGLVRATLEHVGATNAADRWCATIADTGGPSFVRFTDFYTQCWYVGTAISPGTQYAGEPINAVAFQVPGTLFGNVLFDFTISGFAPGTSAADAPGQ